MAYVPPAGDAVSLALTPAGYVPAVGSDVPLRLGLTAGTYRTLIGQGRTACRGALLAVPSQMAALAGRTSAPAGTAIVIHAVLAVVAGRTGATSGRLNLDYDPNLLSAVHAVVGATWQPADSRPVACVEPFQPAPFLRGDGYSRWKAATFVPAGTVETWQPAPRMAGPGIGTWQEASRAVWGDRPHWQGAAFRERGAVTPWQDGRVEARTVDSRFRVRLPLLYPAWRAVWQDAARVVRSWIDGATDARTLLAVEIAVWQQAGYPSNAPNPGPAIPPIFRPPWGTTLRIACSLPGTALRIARVPCVLIPETEIRERRTYMATNSAALVRWPDLTPLPVTSLSIETDFESWCWGLSATLAGPDAWGLVQPNPLACEVQATINGQPWRFLLDVPSISRGFNSDRVTLKGRSRSAWLHDPYTPARNVSQTEAREMQQLGEAALEISGWTLDWQTPNWLVPAYRYTRWETPIGALIKLMEVTGDGLYTDPYLQIITTRPRWPVPSWLVDGVTVDLAIPESAVISLSQNPVYKPPYNGVYVSGTSHGVLALVKIAGTDGALQPNEPVTDDLVCDEAGVAARQRGINVLSDSGAGFEMDAEVLFTPEIGLVRPGMIVRIAGLKGVSRSVRIQAAWSENGLTVRQSIGLERREVES